jgi:Fe2+ or Zn2+ uptake regulation protein
MDRCDAVTTLRRHKISVTEQRRRILSEIHSLDGTFTAASLKESDSLDGIDEATVFRTLALFLERGIIRSVGDSERGQVFEKNCKHNPAHGHFRCTVCGTWTCLPPFSEEEKGMFFTLLTDEYAAESVSVVFQGVCPSCSGGRYRSEESSSLSCR